MNENNNTPKLITLNHNTNHFPNNTQRTFINESIGIILMLPTVNHTSLPFTNFLSINQPINDKFKSTSILIKYLPKYRH